MDLRISNLIDDMACGGVHPETARGRISSYAKNGLIQFRAGANTSPNLYRIEDAAVAIVLSALQDAGVADHDLQRDIGAEIYLRIGPCLAGLAKGESWSLTAHVYRGPMGKFSIPRVAPSDRHSGAQLPPIFASRAAIVLVLDEMLAPLVRRQFGSKDN